MIEKYLIEPTYRKDTGLWLLNTDSLRLPGTAASANFSVRERNIVFIPGGGVGGNHRHPRREAFVGIGLDLQLVWEDDNGVRRCESMSSANGEPLLLYVIEPMTPHAVVNRAAAPAVVVEFADSVQQGVELVDLLI